jgi:LuxR family transcriptional regulator, maltose regulon positive regulatory protein
VTTSSPLVSPWTQKLAPPKATFPVVVRGDAAELERQCAGVALVLIHGPAGFGKTSLLRTLYEGRKAAGQRVAWLTLDRADNDPQRFLMYLDAALQRSGAQAVRRKPTEPAGNAATFEAVIAQIAELNATERTLSLFLDEFDVINSDAVCSIVHDLNMMMTGQGSLFIGSRGLPRLQIGRLRAQGQVVEVGPEDLRFSQDESAQLLTNILGKRLHPDLVSRLQQRTEGWAAALQLAALALQKKLDPEQYVNHFSGTSVELSTYLAEEILAAQPEQIRTMLVKTSILDALCADLSDEICGITNSAEILQRIQSDNLFLFPLDEGREWFRFHKLFTEFMQRELKQHHSELIPELHRSAARWFARHDNQSSAVDQAVLSGDLVFAAELANEYAQQFSVAGQLTTVVRWGDSLPTAMLDRHPRLKAYYAMCLTGGFEHGRAAPLIEELSSPAAMASLDAETRGTLLFTIPFQLLLQDRFEEALTASEANLPRLDADDAQARTAVNNVRNLCLLHLHRYKDIEDTESQVRTLATGVTTWGLVFAECISGMSELAQGRLSNAAAIYRSALQTAIRDASEHSAPTAHAAACLAEVLYESDDLEQVLELMQRYLVTITHLGFPDTIIHAHMHHIRTVYWRSGYAEGCHAVNQLKRLGYERNLTRVVATACAEYSRMALLEGDIVSATRYLQIAEETTPYTTLWDESGVTLRARLLVAQDRGQDAVDLLRAELKHIASTTRKRYALKLRILQAISLKSVQKDSEAMRVLEHCVQDARPESFVRIFADEGPALSPLLREFLATRESDQPTRTYVERLLAAQRRQIGEDEGQNHPLQKLSRRELEVLTQLAEGLSNQAIAAQLGLSLPTVKSHVASILNKLTATNRTEAVATARRLSLLI